MIIKNLKFYLNNDKINKYSIIMRNGKHFI